MWTTKNTNRIWLSQLYLAEEILISIPQEMANITKLTGKPLEDIQCVWIGFDVL
jgi:hypothetical protein